MSLLRSNSRVTFQIWHHVSRITPGTTKMTCVPSDEGFEFIQQEVKEDTFTLCIKIYVIQPVGNPVLPHKCTPRNKLCIDYPKSSGREKESFMSFSMCKTEAKVHTHSNYSKYLFSKLLLRCLSSEQSRSSLLKAFKILTHPLHWKKKRNLDTQIKHG